MTTSVVSVHGLEYGVSKHFWTPRLPILRGVEFEVHEGEVLGFLGPNGSGKTTTIKALLGLLRPDRGDVRLFGEPVRSASVRRRLGFMPERAYFPEHLTCAELLEAHGALAGLPAHAVRPRAAELLERVGMAHAAKQRLGTLSKGMQQRVGLAQALMGDPQLVILDEPMSGLDPLGRHDVRELITSLRTRGTTVFFSTHIIPDVEAICDRVAILVAGRVRRVEQLASLLSETAAGVSIQAEGCSGPALAALAHLHPVPRGAGHEFIAPTSEAANAHIDALRAAGARIVAVQTQRRSLEDIFVRETRARETA